MVIDGWWSHGTAMRVPFLDLTAHEDADDIQAALTRVVASGHYVLGPELETFEQAFAAVSGAAHAVGVGSGTDAIGLILRALNIGPGDEVITTAFSSIYTALAIQLAGAQPVFVDIEPDRLTLEPSAASAAITSRTKAILPVHLYGGPVTDLRGLRDLAARHHVALIEDCCQAHLATWRGHPVGTFGVAGAFSFYPTKNLGAFGDAGAVITHDALLAARIRRLRNGGEESRAWHVEAGVNSRLDELQAAILRARLWRLPAWTARRRALASRYMSSFAGTGIKIPPADPGHVYHLFVIRSPYRDELQAALAQAGIGTLIHYPRTIPAQPAMSGGDYPIADQVAREVLSLPLYPSLSEGDVDRITEVITASPVR